MNERIKNAFDQIQAEEKLKNSVYRNVNRRMHKRERFSINLLFPSKWVIAVTCFVLFLISGLSGYGFYYTEAAAVSIDLNPSIEISINSFGRVVAAKSFDETSQGILDTVSLTHLSYEDAIETLLCAPSMKPFLTDGSVVNVTLVTDAEKEEKWLNQLERCVDQILTNHHKGVMVQYGCTTSSVRQSAHHEGMSMGKYCAIQEVMEEESGTTLEEFQDMNVDEIRSHKDACGHHR